jgi:hypothetical protein
VTMFVIWLALFHPRVSLFHPKMLTYGGEIRYVGPIASTSHPRVIHFVSPQGFSSPASKRQGKITRQQGSRKGKEESNWGRIAA